MDDLISRQYASSLEEEDEPSDLIRREDAINAIYHHLPMVSRERATIMLHECESVQTERRSRCGTLMRMR